MKKIINVTRPSVPDLEKFIDRMEKMFESRQYSNSGPIHNELEIKLAEYLGVPYVSLFSNATIALIIALKQLNLSGEIITTPYSFVATSNAILWNHLKPVFVDINPLDKNIDLKAIENSIGPNTSGILAVHCHGIPCKVKEIDILAEKYNLKVIYDAAHAFGIKYEGRSLLSYGDLSILSFHSTKVFNTFEGGAIVSHSIETKQEIDILRNFGLEDNGDVRLIGLNGKLSEIHSIMGLLELDVIDEHIKKRKKVHEIYTSELSPIKNISFVQIDDIEDYNYSYYPIYIEEKKEINRDFIFEHLKINGINARKYFYPLISDLSAYKKDVNYYTNASKASQNVLCLPIYPEMHESSVYRIARLIKDLYK